MTSFCSVTLCPNPFMLLSQACLGCGGLWILDFYYARIMHAFNSPHKVAKTSCLLGVVFWTTVTQFWKLLCGAYVERHGISETVHFGCSSFIMKAFFSHLNNNGKRRKYKIMLDISYELLSGTMPLCRRLIGHHQRSQTNILELELPNDLPNYYAGPT